jgi:hypothetical protein
MKPPGWLQQVGRGRLSEDGRSVVLTFRVNRSHPGFWLAFIRHLLGREQ